MMRKHRLKLFIIDIYTSRNVKIHYFSFNEVEVGGMGLSIRLLTFSRGYATRSGGSRIKPTLSLDQFIQRGRVLAFYRTILRGTKKIADPTTRAESRKYARDEFERRRNVTDASHVRYLLSIGKTEWEGMERYIDGM